MPVTKKKNIRKSRKIGKKPLLDSSNIVIVTHTVGKKSLFPEKLKKVNKMLRHAKMLDS
jgi:hypothetical protein